MSSPDSSRTNGSGNAAEKGMPLYERSQSEINTPRPSLRAVQYDAELGGADYNFTTPYPTKPAHVLLPSTVRLREQRLKSSDENEFQFASISERSIRANTKAKRLGAGTVPEAGPSGTVPTIRLKRSVKTLRDLYDAQAERTRPSTAASSVTSPVLRPSTAGSGLRSFSSRDGSRGPQSWEAFQRAASSIRSSDSDAVEALPTLDEVISTVRRSESLSSQRDLEAGSSSPNVQTYGSSSSPPSRSSRSMSSPIFPSVGGSSDSGATAINSSSPNFIRLAESSSPTTTSAVSSSPNVVKLGSSSPTSKYAAFTQDDAESPDTIRRDRTARPWENTSFAARIKDSDPFTSSPTDRLDHSAVVSPAAESDDSDPRYPASSPPIESSSIAPTPPHAYSAVTNIVYMPKKDLTSRSHTNLQAAIDSSPAPSIQYPTVHAPKFGEKLSLSIGKRQSRSTGDSDMEKWGNRLSTIPSELSGEREQHGTAASVGDDNLSEKDGYDEPYSEDDHTSEDDSFLEPPARAYLASSREFSGSTIRMVSDADRREATDRIADLRPSEWRSPQIQPRSSAFPSIVSASGSRSSSMRNSTDHPLSSMRSFTSSRQNSMRSVQRPGSSSSILSNLPLPTWARRYYSGDIPPNYLYSASQFSSTTNLTPRASASVLRPTTTRTSTTRSSGPRTPLEHVTSIFRPRTRPRLVSARQSHLEPGIGPLVSHPIDLEAGNNAQQRPVSIAPNPADPRAHWAGAEALAMESVSKEAESPQPPSTPHSAYSPYRLFSRRRRWSPHLHQDYRAGGHPRRSLWHAPSMDESNETLLNWRNAQVFSFIIGFIFPLSWFVAAFLPLPPKPRLQMEEVSRIPTPNLEAQLHQQMDIAADIRYENARWWRNLNRIMCVLGVAVLAIVITLAALYH